MGVQRPSRGRAARRLLARVTAVTMVATGLVVATGRPAGAVPIRCESTPPISASSGGGTFALSANGALWGWGKNDLGQLGRGTFSSPSPTPQQVVEAGPFVTVSAGHDHVLALKQDGSVWAWGDNELGQLGDGTTIDRSRPQRVGGIGPAAIVRAGGATSFAILRDGTVWAWGDNRYGQLGDGTTTDRYVPTQMTALTGVVEIEPAEAWWYDQYTLARKSDGTVWSWGASGPWLGRSGTPSLPGQVAITNVTDLSAGTDHSMALRSDGTVWTWGRNDFGQLGNGQQFTNSSTPVQVTGLTGAVEVSAGGIFSLARRSDGTVAGWGENGDYELLDGTTIDRATPVTVGGLSGVVAIDAAGLHAVALTSGGSVRTWGLNNMGGIGNGTFTTPTSAYTTSITQSQPPTPTKVEPTPGERLVNLVWSEEPAVVIQYVITPYVNGIQQAAISSSSPEAEYAVENLTPGTTYAFTVAAQNCLGTSSPSTPRSDPSIPTETRLGTKGFKLESQRLTDRLTLRANVYNGNLSLVSEDLRIAGTGLDFIVNRTYNSRATGASMFGNRWTSSLGARLQVLTGGSVFFHDVDGAVFGFPKTDTGTYLTPAGIDAAMTFEPNTAGTTADDRYVLTGRFNGEKLVFDDTGKLLQHKDRNGNTMSYEYLGPGGRLSRVQDTQGRWATIAYNASNLVDTITDIRGRTLTYRYDASQNLTRYIDADNKETVFGYDAAGDLTSVTTPVGRKVGLTYDAHKVKTLRWTLAPGTPTTSFDYQADKTVVTDPRNNKTTYKYDRVGRTEEVVDALGNKTSLEYTSHSNVRRFTPGSGGATTIGYNAVHAPQSLAIPTGASTHAEFNDARHPSLPTRVVDTQGKALTYTYDAAGNTRTQTNQRTTQNRVNLTYNARGRVATSTDPNGNLTTYGYDSAGNMTSITPPAPLGAIGPVTYDDVSRVASIRDGLGQVTRYTYDDLDRTTKIEYANGTSVTNVYDGDGNLLQMTDASGTTTMDYDPMGRLIRRQTPDGLSVDYTYDGAGNLLTVTDAGGTTTYVYDKVNLPWWMQTPDGAVTTFTHDAAYNRRSVTHPNGVTLTYGYDASNRLTTLTAVKDFTTLVSRTYSYADPNNGNSDSGLRFRMDDEVAGRSTRYSYDQLNRLTSARTTTMPGGALVVDHRYEYDGSGNRLTSIVDAADPMPDTSQSYGYNGANQLTRHNNETFTYDANGNLSSSSLGAAYTYDAAGRTVAARPSPGKGTPVEHLYRGAGQSERTASGAVARHVETDPVCGLSCIDPSDPDVTTTSFRHSMLGVSAATTGTQTTYFTRDPEGSLLGQRTPAGNHYFIADGLGSIIGVAAADGRMLATYDYDPFGVVVGTTGVADVTRWRFAGAYLDDTGLYKMGERYYDPAVGRFTQQDPIVDVLDPKHWNRYVYVGNDPVNFRDVTGLSFWDTVGCYAKKAWDTFWPLGMYFVFVYGGATLIATAPNLAVGIIEWLGLMYTIEDFNEHIARGTLPMPAGGAPAKKKKDDC